MELVSTEAREEAVVEPRSIFGLAIAIAAIVHLLGLGAAAGVWLVAAGNGAAPPPQQVGEGSLADAVGVLLVDDPDPKTDNVAPPQVAKQVAAVATPPTPAKQPSPKPTPEAEPPKLRGLSLPEDTGPDQQEMVEVEKETPAEKKPPPQQADASPAQQAVESDVDFNRVTAAARAGRIDKFFRSVLEAMGKTRPNAEPVNLTTAIEFVVSKTGNLESIHVVGSSGVRVLDEKVVEWIRRTHFPPPPADADREERTFRFAIKLG